AYPHSAKLGRCNACLRSVLALFPTLRAGATHVVTFRTVRIEERAQRAPHLGDHVTPNASVVVMGGRSCKKRRAAHGSLVLMRPTENGREGHRSEEHTSELQSHLNLVCRLLLEKKKKKIN